MAKWQRSPQLRVYYHDLYQAIQAELKPGRTLEVGSGIGNIKSTINTVTTSDIIKTNFVDRQESSYSLEKSGETWDNIIATDVLHHLEKPMRFFSSASKALTPHGRIILMEPAATYWGRILYGVFHHEPINLHEIRPPFEFKADAISREFANMAMAYGIFIRHRKTTEQLLDEYCLRIAKIDFRDLCTYFFTGGFSRPACLPESCINSMLALEKNIPKKLLMIFGLRILIVIEKDALSHR